jgi:hypothetical protein
MDMMRKNDARHFEKWNVLNYSFFIFQNASWDFTLDNVLSNYIREIQASLYRTKNKYFEI